MAGVVQPIHDEAPHHHGPPTSFIRKYIFSIDHKVIGIQYWMLALFSVFVGMALSLLMRLQLGWPGQEFGFLKTLFPTAAADGTISGDLYLSLVTMHGTIMVFFVLTTAPQGGFGNYFLPIQIGAADMAFPVLNMLSFWVTFVALAVMIAAFFVSAPNVIGPLGGWTGYAPLSAIGEDIGPGQGTGVILWVTSIALFCIASLLGALNFITTMLNLRTKGMSLMRLPLTCWAWFTTAVLALLSFPVLLAGGILLLFDHLLGTSFFIPSGLYVSGKLLKDHSGGSPILWQHLFWFFGHPEVYIAILPGMGLTSHILSTFARKPVFGYRAMVYAIFAIGLLGFFVWGHHMFVSGMSPYSAIAFSLVTLTIGVPSAIKTFNWLGTLWGGQIRFTTPMLFALGFVSLFVSGGITGLFLGQTSIDIQLHDTYFVVGHFHLIMGVAAIFGMFAGTYFWFPKMFGKMMNETLGKIHFVITFIGVNAIFIPMHIMGMAGATRRYAFHYNPYTGEGLQYLSNIVGITRFVSYMAFITIAAQLIFVANLIWSWAKGRRAEINPWEATSLEWTVPSPPPHDNFGGHEPEVYRGPYEFSVPGAPKDYVMQTDPEPVGAHGD
ncbi:MAG TPA: cbb3-type cytochrome c oxidase subunit I [Blastocatellia bacterium]|nr:cbb3-type cytochrome c oxidase subunit I [Blastocatellia bacterium]